MCHETSHRASFLATVTAVREETPEPQAFVAVTQIECFIIGKGKEELHIQGTQLEVVYQSLPHNIDFTCIIDT